MNQKPSVPDHVVQAFEALKASTRTLRQLETAKKNRVLLALADRVLKERENLLKANQEDLERLPSETTTAFRDRLTLNQQRIEAMVESLRQVASLPDPVSEEVDKKTLPNGLLLRRVRSPLGVILMIFESRPNVVLEAFSLAFKTGNAIALRGGSDSRATSQHLYALMRETLTESGVNADSFYGMNDYDRGIVEALLKRRDWIDVVVPRGGERLIDFVQKTAEMPIIKNDRGLCHTYVAEDADLEMAVRIVNNAKTQRPGVCNSLETVLVHRAIAPLFLPRLFAATSHARLEWHADPESRTILKDQDRVRPASAEDWNTEYLDQIMNCRVVGSLDEAIAHIEEHGSKHSEAIVTRSEEKARRFQAEVDAAAVYWNASTRFTDGFEFGLGGELGISTQKLHVRGPVGLRELTTPRWIIDGSGQIRN